MGSRFTRSASDGPYSGFRLYSIMNVSFAVRFEPDPLAADGENGLITVSENIAIKLAREPRKARNAQRHPFQTAATRMTRNDPVFGRLFWIRSQYFHDDELCFMHVLLKRLAIAS